MQLFQPKIIIYVLAQVLRHFSPFIVAKAKSPKIVSYKFLWNEVGLKGSYDDIIYTADESFLPMGTKHGKHRLKKSVNYQLLLKNKHHLLTFYESILVSLWTFQLTRIYYRISLSFSVSQVVIYSNCEQTNDLCWNELLEKELSDIKMCVNKWLILNRIVSDT